MKKVSYSQGYVLHLNLFSINSIFPESTIAQAKQTMLSPTGVFESATPFPERLSLPCIHKFIPAL